MDDLDRYIAETDAEMAVAQARFEAMTPEERAAKRERMRSFQERVAAEEQARWDAPERGAPERGAPIRGER